MYLLPHMNDNSTYSMTWICVKGGTHVFWAMWDVENKITQTKIYPNFNKNKIKSKSIEP
jgi:hypothetical protein